MKPKTGERHQRPRFISLSLALTSATNHRMFCKAFCPCRQDRKFLVACCRDYLCTLPASCLLGTRCDLQAWNTPSGRLCIPPWLRRICRHCLLRRYQCHTFSHSCASPPHHRGMFWSNWLSPVRCNHVHYIAGRADGRFRKGGVCGCAAAARVRAAAPARLVPAMKALECDSFASACLAAARLSRWRCMDELHVALSNCPTVSTVCAGAVNLPLYRAVETPGFYSNVKRFVMATAFAMTATGMQARWYEVSLL